MGAKERPSAASTGSGSSPGALQLAVCVASIYAAYLSWAVLQERIATTPYGPDKQVFRAALVLNTAQSTAATLTGALYLFLRDRPASARAFVHSIYGERRIVAQFLLLACTSSLASPFGYASLRYIDYPTQILGKSCKLLPVMALGVLVYGRSFPRHKYLIVAMVTAGVALFTLCADAGGQGHGGGKAKSKSKGVEKSSAWGLFLLSINLLLDGLTNSTQDQMFARYGKRLSGPGMMVGLNAMSTALVSVYLLSPATKELGAAAAFIGRHPEAGRDVALFALCGALGQLAIFYTLEKFGALVLVTVTLTRKMFTMLLSVLWFNHRLAPGQYAGVALVFAGITIEAWLKRQADLAKKARPPPVPEKRATPKAVKSN